MYNGLYLMLQEPFKTKYPTYTWFAHDSYGHAKGNNIINDNFHNRLGEGHCLNTNTAGTVQCCQCRYESYASCLATTRSPTTISPSYPPTNLPSAPTQSPSKPPTVHDPCMHASSYLPRFAWQDVTSIACIGLNYPDPGQPQCIGQKKADIQPWSFWCYADLRLPDPPPSPGSTPAPTTFCQQRNWNAPAPFAWTFQEPLNDLPNDKWVGSSKC